MNDWYEQWSKAGANPNFRVENPQEYISNFNWVNNWFSEYFFTKVSDFLGGILLLIIILLFTFRSKNRKFNSKLKGKKLIFSILLILFIEWFYNHPSLRYGGYPLICLLLFLPVSNILSNRIHKSNIFYKTNVLLVIALTIFLGRNVNRLINENVQYNFNPFTNPVYRVNKGNFKIQNKFKEIIDNKFFCRTNSEKCIKNVEIDVKENYGYKIFFRNRS